jgi:hypothetical protein
MDDHGKVAISETFPWRTISAGTSIAGMGIVGAACADAWAASSNI